MSSRSKYFYNTSWLLAENILRLAASLFVGIWVARYLGPEKYGLLSYVIAFTSIFGVVTKLGLDEIVIKEIVERPEASQTILGTSFYLKLFSSVFVILFIVLFERMFSNDPKTEIYIYIVSMSYLFQSSEVIDFYYQSQVQAKKVSKCRVFQLIISSCIKILLIFRSAELFWFILCYLFDSIVLAFFLIFTYCKEHKGFFRNADLSVALRQLKASWPLVLSSIVSIIYMRIDQIMIKEMLGESEVGIYSAAVRISEMWYFVPMIVASSLYPAIINAKKQSEILYYSRLQRIISLLAWISIIVSITMFFLSDTLIYLLFGNAYIKAGNVLVIHIWTGLFVCFGVVSSKWFLIENLQVLAFKRTFLGMLANIGLNFLLIPSFGIMGAAFATFVSQMIAAYLSDVLNQKTRPIFWMKTRAFLPQSLMEVFIRSKK